MKSEVGNESLKQEKFEVAVKQEERKRAEGSKKTVDKFDKLKNSPFARQMGAKHAGEMLKQVNEFCKRPKVSSN